MICNNIDPVPSIDELRNISNFTIDQLAAFLAAFVDYKCADALAYKCAMYCASLSGSLGFVMYILMLLSLRKLSISGCTMIYHKAMVVLELPHMVVMMTYGLTVLNIASISNTWFWIQWTNRLQWGWMIGDWAKLAVSTLTAFLSLERCIAVLLPQKFDLINKNQVAYSAAVIAFFIGSAHGWAVFAKEAAFDDILKQYFGQDTDFGKGNFYLFINTFIVIVKVSLCIIIFILSVATAVSLHSQAKKVMGMSTSAKSEWAAKRRVCAFSFIVGMCTLIDHLFWSIHKAAVDWTAMDTIGVIEQLTNPKQYTFDQVMHNVNLARLISATGNIQGFTGQFAHGWRFMIYLMLNKSMRDAFKDAMHIRTKDSVVPFDSSTNQISVTSKSKK